MIPNHSPSQPLPTEVELLDALQQFFHDRFAPTAAEAIDVELALFRLQKLLTLGQLATEVAHDFGNLTTVLLGYSELLLAATEAHRPEREYLAELHRAAERASTLTAQLLGFCRQTAGILAPIDLAGLVRGLKNLLGRVLGPPVQLTIMAPEMTALVLADARLVEQALVNLALNAREALPAGGHVSVAVEPVRLEEPLSADLGEAPAGDYVRLSISDDGCGLNTEARAQLFRPFFTTKDRGIGLGLTIVARIARQSSAAVVVQSAPNHGTTVALYFPVLSEQRHV